MRTTIQTIGYILLASLLGAVFAGMWSTYQTALGSVAYGNEYQATLINASDVGTSSIKSLPGSVGSIIVASTSPVSTNGPMLAIYQTASTTVATTTMTPVITFGASGAVTPPAGTYTFDVGVGGGIYLWVNPAFNGSYTLTYR